MIPIDIVLNLPMDGWREQVANHQPIQQSNEIKKIFIKHLRIFRNIKTDNEY